MRVIVMLFPIALVIAIELGMRAAGLYEDQGLFESDVEFFPEWSLKLKPKQPNQVRIFALGGSSTQGFGCKRRFSLVLEEQLQAALPDHVIEVENGGKGGYGSHRVAAVLKRAAQFSPDYIVVYLGHNEFLEEIFFDPKGILAKVESTQSFANSLRIVRCANAALPSAEPPVPRLQRHFLGNHNFPLIRSEQYREDRLAFFRANMEEMIAVANNCGATIVFAPAIPNLLSEPGDAKHGDITTEARAEYAATLKLAEAALAKGEYADAERLGKDLIEADPAFATGHYIAGCVALAQGQQNAGVSALRLANTKDWRGDRSSDPICAAVLDVCTKNSIPVDDLRETFYSRLQGEYKLLAAGQEQELFTDHCHPTNAGHQIIADALTKRLLPLIRGE